MRHIYWAWGRGRVRQIPSPYGVGGETGYTAQKDLKSIKLQHGGGKDNKGLVFLFLHSKTLLGFICSFWFFCSCIPRPSLVLSALSGFSVPAFQDPPWFYLLFRPWVTTICTLLYVKQIINKDLLYSTGTILNIL